MTARLGRPVAPGRTRRSRPVRRASAGLTATRAGAALAMLMSAAAIYGVAASPAFGLTKIELSGIRYSVAADVRARLDVPNGTNLFGLSTEPLAARLRDLPTVADATVTVRLPGTLAVGIEERVPVLAWRVAGQRYLVDRGGTLFAELDATNGSSLPVVDDRRHDSRSFGIGSTLAAVDLDAATRLGSLRPADVGSSASALTVAVTDDQGFVVRGTGVGWTAVFGFYTPSLRTPDLVPGQVRLLASLLARAGESTVDRVILASATDGTYTPKGSPVASPSAAP